MTAGKKVSHDNTAPVKATKSSSWFSKWIPGTIAKKAMEAFKLIEKAVFMDNVEEPESNKVQVLEIQVKKLQQKVDELMKLKLSPPVDVPAVPDATKPNKVESNNIPTVSVPAASGVVAASKPLAEVVKSDSVPVKPRPFSAADLMTKKLKKTTADNSEPAAKSELPKPISIASAAVSIKNSPAKAVRPPMKPFSSTDLKQIKLNKRKPSVGSGAASAKNDKAKTPARPVNKPMSMQSALKHAIKNKFSKAKGSPKRNSGSDDSDNDIDGEISEW